MKKVFKTLTCLFLICFYYQGHAQTSKDQILSLTGKIHGIDSGKIYMYTPGQKTPDSAAIANGQFKLITKLGSPDRRSFMIQPGSWQFMAFADVPQVALDIDTTDAMHYYSNGKDNPTITRIKETGSPMADAYEEFMKETGQYEYLYLAAKQKTASKDSATIIKNKIDSLFSSFDERSMVWVGKYVEKHPSSFVSVFFFKQLFDQSRNKSAGYLRGMLAKFSGEAKESAPYQALVKRLATLENMQTGKPAPDFTLQKRDKSKLTLSSMRGSVVMLDFWASWCGPCRAGIPAWKKVYAKYHSKGFEIIGVSDDRKWSDWTQALDKEKMPWLQVIDKFPSENSKAIVGQLYGGYAMPYYVLIDKKGDIIAEGKDDVITKKLAEIFN